MNSNPFDTAPAIGDERKFTHFSYRGLTADRQPIRGTIESGSAEAAKQQLASLGVQVEQVEQIEHVHAVQQDSPVSSDVIKSNRGSGEPVGAATLEKEMADEMRSLGQLSLEPGIRRLIRQCVRRLDRGEYLLEICRDRQWMQRLWHPELLLASHRGGSLANAAMQCGEYEQLLRALRFRMQTIFWSLLVAISIPLLAIMAMQPMAMAMTEIFADFDTELPLSTRLVVGSPIWLEEYMFAIPTILVAIAMHIIGFSVYRRISPDNQGVQNFLDRFLWLPLVGPMIRFHLLCRWCFAVAVCRQCGVNAERSMSIGTIATGSKKMQSDAWLFWRSEVGMDNAHLPPPMLVPPAVILLLESARDRAAACRILREQSRDYLRRFDRRWQTLLFLLIPSLVVLMFFSIGTFVIAMFLPFVRLVQNVSG